MEFSDSAADIDAERRSPERLKNNSKRMPLTSFLNKLISKAVSSALNDDSMFGGALKQKIRIGKTEVKCINQYQEKIDAHLMVFSQRKWISFHILEIYTL